MSVRSGQVVARQFFTRNPTTGEANADSLPVGTLILNGVANAATVTVVNVSTGIYTFSVTLPTLVFGDEVQVRIAQVMATIPDNLLVWEGICDLAINSSGQPTVGGFANGSFTPASLPATGFAYTHGLQLTSDQGTPGLAILASGGFSGLSLSSGSSGTALTIHNTSTGEAIDVVGPVDFSVATGSCLNFTPGSGGFVLTGGDIDANLVRKVLGSGAGSIVGVGVDANVSASGLSGPSSVTLTFHDASNNPVPNVIFSVVGQGSGQANGSGIASFGLANGTYTVTIAPTNLVLFSNTSLVVSGTTALTITGTATNIPTPGVGQVSAYLYIRDSHGNIVTTPSYTITFQLVDAQAGGDAWNTDPFDIASDGTGLVSTLLEANARYQARTINGKWVPFTTGASGAYQIPEVLGQM